MNYLTVVIILLISAVSTLAQVAGDPYSVYEPAAGNDMFVGARSAGLAATQIAAAEDGAALWYNPALLIAVGRVEVAGTISHQRFFNKTTYDLDNLAVGHDAQVNHTRLNSLWAVLPIQDYHQTITLALAVARVKSFDRTFRYESENGWWQNPVGDGFAGGEDDKGGLWSYSAGFGFALTPQTSIGAAVDIYDGQDNFTQWVDSVANDQEYALRRSLVDEYSGYSGRIGMTFSPLHPWQFGAVIRFPMTLTVEQDEQVRIDSSGQVRRYRGSGTYRYRQPFSFGLGGAFVYRDLLITTDVLYTDYTQLSYLEGLDPVLADRNVKRYYRDVLSLGIGIEYQILPLGITWRAGYRRDPAGFRYLADTEPQTLATGLSILLTRTMKLDIVATYSFWSALDPNFWRSADTAIRVREKCRAQRFYVSLCYRK